MKIWGPKTESLFDIWSIEHFISGVTIGSILCIILVSLFHPEIKNHENKVRKKAIKDNINGLHFHYFAIVFLIAYIWEVLEFYMEAGYTGNQKITYWFQGVEFWLNRALTDPLMVALGAWCTLRFYSKTISWSARVFSATWLAFHVFVFPDCMYLQNTMYDLYVQSDLMADISDIIFGYQELFLKILA